MNILFLVIFILSWTPLPDYILCKFVYPKFDKRYRNRNK